MRARRLISAGGVLLLALLGLLLWPSGAGAAPALVLSASHGQAGASFTATASFDPVVPGTCFQQTAQFFWDQALYGQDASGNQIGAGVQLVMTQGTCTATVSLVPIQGTSVGPHTVRAVENSSTDSPKPTATAPYTVDPPPTQTPSPVPTHTATPAPTAHPTATPTHTAKPTATPTATPTPRATPTPTPSPTATASPSPSPQPSASPSATATASPSAARASGPPPGGTHGDYLRWLLWLGAAAALGGWVAVYLTLLRGSGNPELTVVSLIGAVMVAALLIAVQVARSR